MKHMKREPPVHPPGGGKSLKATLLEKGADWLQDVAPVKQFDIYVAGFHCARHAPSMQMEAHHYCHQVNGEFLQCILFDGNTENVNLIGIEYIISERLFGELPRDEQPYWHPHNFEILSGQLVAPGLPEAAEKELMKMLVNSYGKTWHTWHSGRHDQGAGNALPLGEPRLMWSFNRDGEADEAMKRDRDEAMQVDTARKRRERQELVSRTHPQRGVDLLKEAFPDAEEAPPPGVREAGMSHEENIDEGGEHAA